MYTRTIQKWLPTIQLFSATIVLLGGLLLGLPTASHAADASCTVSLNCGRGVQISCSAGGGATCDYVQICDPPNSNNCETVGVVCSGGGSSTRAFCPH